MNIIEKIERQEAEQEAHRLKVAELYKTAAIIGSRDIYVGLQACDLEFWRHGARYYVTEKRPSGYLQLLGEFSTWDAAHDYFIDYYYYRLTD